MEINGQPVHGSPWPIQIHAGPAVGTSCTVTGDGIVAAVAGQRALQMKDLYGNLKVYGSGAESISVVLTSLEAFPADVNYLGHGQYHTATAAGTYSITIRVDGVEPASGPFAVLVAPGPLCAACSIMTCTTSSNSNCALTPGDKRWFSCGSTGSHDDFGQR